MQSATLLITTETIPWEWPVIPEHWPQRPLAVVLKPSPTFLHTSWVNNWLIFCGLLSKNIFYCACSLMSASMMSLEVTGDEISLLLDVLAKAGANDLLPSGLLPFFWSLSAAYSGLSEVSKQSPTSRLMNADLILDRSRWGRVRRWGRRWGRVR